MSTKCVFIKIELLSTDPATPSGMRSCNRWQKYPGFGEEHTNAEWARRLKLPRNTFWRYRKRGLTIEQIVELRGIKYPAE